MRGRINVKKPSMLETKAPLQPKHRSSGRNDSKVHFVFLPDDKKNCIKAPFNGECDCLCKEVTHCLLQLENDMNEQADLFLLYMMLPF